MVEEKFSPDFLDDLICATEHRLKSRGIYTSVGNYDHSEMLELVCELSRMTNVPVSELVRCYGNYLFGRFTLRFPFFFTGLSDSFEFLEMVEGHIHKEVNKLYNSAELPTFECNRKSPNHLTLVYRSPRPYAMLALGLIEGCANHFCEDLSIATEDLSDGEMKHARFEIVRS